MTDEEFNLKMKVLVMQKEFTKLEKFINWSARFVDQHFWLLLALEVVTILWFVIKVRK